ncbi:hypothetical protein GCK32_017549, partial [Trichostrongylus colubriformis]
MPGVTELTQRFERGSRSDSADDRLEEQYRSVKSYTSPTKKEPPYKPREIIIPTEKKKETFTGHTVFPSREQQREQVTEETRGSTPVRSVVEQFESKIEEGRSTPDRRPYQYKEKFEEMSVREHRETQPDRDREVYIPSSDLLPSRKTYTESITSRKTLVGPEKEEQPYKERREITREEVQRIPSRGKHEMRERVEQERYPPYREMKEVRLEEVERSGRDFRRDEGPVSPPPTKEYADTRRREDRTETVTTETVRTFPRVAIPQTRSPTPPRVTKSSLEIVREELLEERRKREERQKEKEERERREQEQRERERRERERREEERREQERREQERRE